MKAWSIPNNQSKYEISHGDTVNDVVIGREETPLYNRIVSVSDDHTCRISNLETGAEVKILKFDSYCSTMAVDKAQTMIAVGTDNYVAFIETTNLTIVKKVPMEYVYSLAFNKRNNCMLAVTRGGEIHSFKF